MPSNAMKVRLVGSSFGRVNVRRYQPVPVGKKPPAARLGAFSSTGPAMLQSWGRVTGFQAESSKVGIGLRVRRIGGSASWW
jgi:hypothetical protein